MTADDKYDYSYRVAQHLKTALRFPLNLRFKDVDTGPDDPTCVVGIFERDLKYVRGETIPLLELKTVFDLSEPFRKDVSISLLEHGEEIYVGDIRVRFEGAMEYKWVTEDESEQQYNTIVGELTKLVRDRIADIRATA